MTDAYAVLPHMKIDEEADRTEIGRSFWSIGLARPAGSPAAEIVVATDRITIDEMNGAITCWSDWDENAEKRDEPLATMAFNADSWTYFYRNDPWGNPLPIAKALGAFGGTTTVK